MVEQPSTSKLTNQGLGPIKVSSVTDHAAAIQPANRVALRRVADALRAGQLQQREPGHERAAPRRPLLGVGGRQPGTVPGR